MVSGVAGMQFSAELERPGRRSARLRAPVEWAEPPGTSARRSEGTVEPVRQRKHR